MQQADEGIDEPLCELEEARALHGVDAQDFRALEVGETLVLPAAARATRAA